jgi:hypothetical protein
MDLCEWAKQMLDDNDSLSWKEIIILENLAGQD